jgi:hypothetical protein
MVDFMAENQRQAGYGQHQQKHSADQAGPGMDKGPAAYGLAFHFSAQSKRPPSERRPLIPEMVTNDNYSRFCQSDGMLAIGALSGKQICRSQLVGESGMAGDV